MTALISMERGSLRAEHGPPNSDRMNRIDRMLAGKGRSTHFHPVHPVHPVQKMPFAYPPDEESCHAIASRAACSRGPAQHNRYITSPEGWTRVEESNRSEYSA